ncbi:MAG TPA: MFS transporter [Solirubrobacteraceae bacterium]|nr:MFS transporter [Solirubrobacteraceae bacterium]
MPAPAAIALGLATAQLIVVPDTPLMAVALPSIQHSLSLSATSLQWVLTAPTLAFGGFLVAGGRAGDIYGCRRVYLACMTAFAGSSLAASAANTGALLIAARAVEGVSGAGAAPTALALLIRSAPCGSARQETLALNGVLVACGIVAGWVIGGALTTWLGWRFVLLVNVPIAGILVAFEFSELPEASREDGIRSIDLAGAASLTTAFLCLIFATALVGIHHDVRQPVLGLLCGFGLLLVLFVIIERRAVVPLVPGRLLANPAVAATATMQFLSSSVTAGVLITVTLYLQHTLGYSPLHAGVIFLVPGVGFILGGLLAMHTVRISLRGRQGGGIALQLAGTAMLWTVGKAHPIGPILLGLWFVGFGTMVSLVASTTAITSVVADGDLGLAAGLVNTAVELGSAFGIALLVALATTSGSAIRGRHGVGASITPGSLSHAMVGAVSIMVIASMLSLVARLRLSPSTDRH